MKIKKDITLKLCIEDALYLKNITSKPIHCEHDNWEDPCDIISRKYINEELSNKLKEI